MDRKSIRFIHAADLHLGRGFPYREESFLSRGYKDRFRCFTRILGLCKTYKVDYLFLTGDIFEQEEFTRQDGLQILGGLEGLQSTKVFLILGNHDYKLKSYLLENGPENLFVFSSKNLVVYEDPEKKTRIMGQSWDRESLRESLYVTEEEFKPGYRHILLHHGVWSGEDYFPLNLSDKMIKKFDYIGMGHIHKPMKFEQNAFMVGTPEVLEHKDLGQRGVLLGDLDQDLKVDFIPTSSRTIIEEEINHEKQESFTDIVKQIREGIEDEKDIYHFILKGYPLEEGEVNSIQSFLVEEGIYSFFTDFTDKKASLADIYARHEKDIVGEFIRYIDTLDLEDRMKEKVAEVGIRALLKGGQK